MLLAVVVKCNTRPTHTVCTGGVLANRFLLDKVVDQFLSSSSRLSVHCARVLRQTAFKRTPEVNMRDMGLNDSDMK